MSSPDIWLGPIVPGRGYFRFKRGCCLYFTRSMKFEKRDKKSAKNWKFEIWTGNKRNFYSELSTLNDASFSGAFCLSLGPNFSKTLKNIIKLKIKPSSWVIIFQPSIWMFSTISCQPDYNTSQGQSEGKPGRPCVFIDIFLDLWREISPIKKLFLHRLRDFFVCTFMATNVLVTRVTMCKFIKKYF